MDRDQKAFSSIIYVSVKLYSRILWWKNLKALTFSYCKGLIETPDFSELPNVKELILEGCEGLVDLHTSIGQHKKLQALNLKGCKSLRACGLGKLEMSALKEFVLCGCSNMYVLPEFGECMKNLEMLDVGETNLVKLPESLGLLTGLKRLNLGGCKNLVSLPQSISNLEYLTYVNMDGCLKLNQVPEEHKEIESSGKLDASEAALAFENQFSNVLTMKMSTWKYDIFLSFRGEDTRRGFTSHLYHTLVRSGLKVFMDNKELGRGEGISQELLQAIKESRVAIVVLSENYASSSWCLDELQHILASRDEQGQIVFPIYYNVDPSDVRKQQKSFGQAFYQIERKFQQDQQKVQEWRVSLTLVANISGFDSSQYRTEVELIENVVDVVWGQLRKELPLVSASDSLIGIDWRVEEMVSELGIGLDGVRFIGIWGLGGVGKTTLARAIYERFHHQFDFHCFLPNVMETSERNGLLHLQNKLLSRFNIKNFQIEDLHEGKITLGHLFRDRKVMLILDDIDDISQLENLAGSREWFGDGSRIIITTRNAQLLTSHGVVNEIYEVKPMNHDESLQLFCQNAFRGDPPENKLLELAKSVINYANGLPLALCVLGSCFVGRRENEWEDALDMLKKDSNNDIFKALRFSYNALNPVEKTIFLDIACFFNTWGKDEVTQILESCGLVATIGMKNLVDKSLLVEIELGGIMYIEMHDLVQEMGKLIVLDEFCNDVGKRSRLWLSHDIDQVLNENLGSDATQGVVLPSTFAKDEACWDPTSFLTMRLLRLLIISCNVDLPYGLMGFPSTLKVLHWYGFPCEALPSTKQINHLVYLKMQNSKLKRLSNDKQCMMSNLKILDLCHSKNLLKSPYFSGFQNLKRLVLEGCTSLVEIHSSLGQLQCLVEVNLKGCLKLKILPIKLEMNSLEQFVLSGCIRVRNLPEFGEEMYNLTMLDVKETSITKLPESIEYLTGLETLDLTGCQNLVGLPHNFHKLRSLKVLYVSGCSNLSELPKNLYENLCLEKLDASGTAISEVPSSICCLRNLKTLALHGCKRPTSKSSFWSLVCNQMFQRHSFPKGLTLPICIFKIESLTELDLSYCNIDDEIIPFELSGLLSLQKLDLSGNKFVYPLLALYRLQKLHSLYLNSCAKLRFLPHSSPSLNLLDAGECGSLDTLSCEDLLDLFTSMKLDCVHDDEMRRMFATLSVTVPGSGVPSWFENHNHLLLNERHVDSVTIDIPEDEWLGIGLCTLIDDKMCWPRWGFDFIASDGKRACLPGRTREHEKAIKSCHLWMVFWKIEENKRDELSRNYSQICLKYYADWEQPSLTSFDAESIKFGWRFIRTRDLLEQRLDRKNTVSSEEEQSLSLLEGTQCHLLEWG